MASNRVVKTGKGMVWTGGQHRHIETLCLEDGRRVAKATAISNIENNVESYYTMADGEKAKVKVVQRCDRCASKYLRTDRDRTAKDNLLEMPDC